MAWLAMALSGKIHAESVLDDSAKEPPPGATQVKF
jgi:hypothetical protein